MRRSRCLRIKRIWKKAEGRIAALFVARRQVLSGSCGRDDLSRRDCNHPWLFIELKFRKMQAVRSLYETSKALARKEGKTPLVALVDKGRAGSLLCLHSDDLPKIVAEFTLANAEIVEEAIRNARSATLVSAQP